MNLLKKCSIISLFILSTNSLIISSAYAQDNNSNTTNTRVDNSEKTTLRLSDDIGKMADRIWEMADRILKMADKILETQKIQSKNLEMTQNNILESIKLINKTLEQNNKLLQEMIDVNSKMIGCMCKK